MSISLGWNIYGCLWEGARLRLGRRAARKKQGREKREEVWEEGIGRGKDRPWKQVQGWGISRFAFQTLLCPPPVRWRERRASEGDVLDKVLQQDGWITQTSSHPKPNLRGNWGKQKRMKAREDRGGIQRERESFWTSAEAVWGQAPRAPAGSSPENLAGLLWKALCLRRRGNSPLGTNLCSSTSSLSSESPISHAAKAGNDAKDAIFSIINVGLILLISNKTTARDSCASCPVHALVTEVFIGRYYLMSCANAAVPFHQLRQAELPRLGRRDGVTMVMRWLAEHWAKHPPVEWQEEVVPYSCPWWVIADLHNPLVLH